MTNFQPKPKRRYKRYSSEFKREALLRASDEGMTDKAVCDDTRLQRRPDIGIQAPASPGTKQKTFTSPEGHRRTAIICRTSTGIREIWGFMISPVAKIGY